MKTVDVIIPVYKPDKEFFKLLTMLQNQTLKPDHIILINTGQAYFDNLIAGTNFWHLFKAITLKHVSKREFDHARTRNYGVSLSKSDYFLMMTQDAMPADEYMIENLFKEADKARTAVAYARQLVKEDASLAEQFTRKFNYPDQSERKGEKDVERLGIKAYFSSNVCAMYSRKIFDELRGFGAPAIFNEDMIYAYHGISAGYEIAYVAEAMVFHSHNYKNKQQFNRNFDIGVSHKDNPEVFEQVTTESEGAKLVWKAVKHFLKTGKIGTAFAFLIQSICKYVGFFLGKHYTSLPVSWVHRFSMNKEYWK